MFESKVNEVYEALLNVDWELDSSNNSRDIYPAFGAAREPGHPRLVYRLTPPEIVQQVGGTAAVAKVEVEYETTDDDLVLKDFDALYRALAPIGIESVTPRSYLDEDESRVFHSVVITIA